MSEEDWSLLTDSADILSHQMGLTTDEYVETYETPAFKALDEAGTCETEGPSVEPILERLVELGGSREALPDQEAAYIEWRAAGLLGCGRDRHATGC
ncbi:hypothetical protein N8D56_05820 [Devosia sp. A8/3-2]|nr:hypothetical protein N8D56_05820 [Devosia sp. A8/3-2]